MSTNKEHWNEQMRCVEESLKYYERGYFEMLKAYLLLKKQVKEF